VDQQTENPLPNEAGLPFLEVLQLLNEASEAFVYLHNAEGHFLHVSPGVSKITGYSQEEWKVHYSTFMTDNPLNERVHLFTQEALEKGKKCPPYPVEIRHKDGRRLLLEVNEAPVVQNGRVAGLVGIARDITKEIQLLKLEETFQSFLRTCPISLVIYNAEGTVRYLNPAFERTFGWTLQELAGQKIPFVPESEIAPTREGIRKVLKGEMLQDFETSRLTKTGVLLDISLTSFRYLDEGGAQAGITVMLRDVTGKRNLEKELRRSLDFEQSLIQSSMDGIISVDPQGQVMTLNEGAGKILGYTPEEVIGRIHVTRLYPPGKAHEVKAALHSPDFGGVGKLLDYRTELLTKGGTVLPMRLSGSLLYEGDREIGSVGFFHDLTHQKTMEAVLTREKAIMEELVNGSPIPTFVLDRDHRVVFWNRACVELTGVSGEEMTGSRDIWKPFYPVERPVLANLILSQNLSLLSRLYGEKKLRAYPLLPGAFEAEDFFESLKGKDRYLHFMSAPIYDQTGELWGAIESIQDLSEHKALEARLSELATMDGLTGVYNRQYLEKRLEEEIAKARRYRDHLSMILLDIDQFKAVNDRYGHLVGDQVLKKTAEIIKSCLRTTDIVARFGGDEFVVILPRTDPEQLAFVRERLVVTLKNLSVLDQNNQTRYLTVSLGDYSDSKEYDQILRRADLNMYRQKPGRG
jgi:diguanylate cyclase (GGDEF)-like protein/PAS domain S-box-containing protein